MKFRSILLFLLLLLPGCVEQIPTITYGPAVTTEAPTHLHTP